jgi:lysophospholipase L1-like esterase
VIFREFSPEAFFKRRSAKMEFKINQTATLLFLGTLTILTGCQNGQSVPQTSNTASSNATSSAMSSAPVHYVQPFIENMHVRPDYDDVKIRPHTKTEGSIEPLTYTIADPTVISITDKGYVHALKRGRTKVTAKSEHFETEFNVYSNNVFPGFGDEHWAYRLDNYTSTIGSPKEYTCFLGDSFFDERYFYTDFYQPTIYGNKQAYCGGIGGATTHDMRILLDEWTLGFSPKNIVLNISCNNIDNLGEDGLTSYYNLWALLEDIHEKNSQLHVYALSITPEPPVIENWTEAQKNNALLKSYCEANDWIDYLPVGEAFEQNLIDQQNAGSEAAPEPYLNEGGMHPSAEGYRVIESLLAEKYVIPSR